MIPNPLAALILAALILEALLRLAADILNQRDRGGAVPAELAGLLDAAGSARAQAYRKARTRLGWAAEGFHLSVLIAFWLAGGFAWLDRAARGFDQGAVVTGLLFIGFLAAARSLLGLPFALYATFGIETRFGFNRTGWRTFIADRLKGLVLGLMLGGTLLALVLGFFQAAGGRAWWLSWTAVTVVLLAVHYVAPTWILPWFNRFEPLEDRDLEAAIRGYAAAIGFPVQQVKVMDGSRRSSKGNAFFTGFGRRRRIVLFDTLLGQLDREEVLAVVAHEMGHYKLGHIPRNLALGVIHAGLLFYLLHLCLGWEPLYAAFHLEQPSVYAGLTLFGLLMAPLNLAGGVALQALSRRFELAADRFAAETSGRGAALGRALKKMAVLHLAHFNPHPLHVWLNHSHPPLPTRLRAIRQVDGGEGI